VLTPVTLAATTATLCFHEKKRRWEHVSHWLYGFCKVGRNYGQWFCSCRQTGENYMCHTRYMAYVNYAV